MTMNNIILPGAYKHLKAEHKKGGITYFVVCDVVGVDVSFEIDSSTFDVLSGMEMKAMQHEIEKQAAVIRERVSPLTM